MWILKLNQRHRIGQSGHVYTGRRCFLMYWVDVLHSVSAVPQKPPMAPSLPICLGFSLEKNKVARGEAHADLFLAGSQPVVRIQVETETLCATEYTCPTVCIFPFSIDTCLQISSDRDVLGRHLSSIPWYPEMSISKDENMSISILCLKLFVKHSIIFYIVSIVGTTKAHRILY